MNTKEEPVGYEESQLDLYKDLDLNEVSDFDFDVDEVSDLQDMQEFDLAGDED